MDKWEKPGEPPKSGAVLGIKKQLMVDYFQFLSSKA